MAVGALSGCDHLLGTRRHPIRAMFWAMLEVPAAGEVRNDDRAEQACSYCFVAPCRNAEKPSLSNMRLGNFLRALFARLRTAFAFCACSISPNK